MNLPLPNDEQILNGIPPQHIKDLEDTLVQLFFERAQREGKNVVITPDKSRYEQLFRNKDVFQKNTYVIYKSPDNIIDMRPIVERLLDTPEGLAYAKIMRLSRA